MVVVLFFKRDNNMKTVVENQSFKGLPLAKVEIHLINVTVNENNIAKTYHKVSNVRLVDGVEMYEFLASYNHPFEYQGGNIMQEGMDAVLTYLADPTT